MNLEHADEAICITSKIPSMELGERYEVLDVSWEQVKTEFGWMPSHNFNPYYDVKKGDIIVATKRVFLGIIDDDEIYCSKGQKFEVAESVLTRSVITLDPIQLIFLDLSHPLNSKMMAKHINFKPFRENTLREKVRLV